MRYTILKEKSWDKGKLRTWYIIAPKNLFLRFTVGWFTSAFNYYLTYEEALKIAKLKSEKKWDKVISITEVGEIEIKRG